ncbi:hypothetical protein EIP91_002507 [Steccherinum ochraceum]|uniref:Uncharacterized protein n=1 Tax=Steccherinum ochraceum TaxID=92696 RepID=A0A4R0RFP0_9APHY|nr:hypothetical protein EIP91_002507 [Steccherinum ochraceum]
MPPYSENQILSHEDTSDEQKGGQRRRKLKNASRKMTIFTPPDAPESEESPTVRAPRTTRKKRALTVIMSDSSPTSPTARLSKPFLPDDDAPVEDDGFVLPEHIAVEDLDMACALSFVKQRPKVEGRYYAPYGMMMDKIGKRLRDEVPDVTQADVVGKEFYWTQTNYQLPSIIKMSGWGDWQSTARSLGKGRAHDVGGILDALSRKIPDITCTRYKLKIIEQVPGGVRVKIMSSQTVVNAEVKPDRSDHHETTIRAALEQAVRQAQYAFDEDKTLQYLGICVTSSTSWMFYEYRREDLRPASWLPVTKPQDVSNPHTEPDPVSTPEKDGQKSDSDELPDSSDEEDGDGDGPKAGPRLSSRVQFHAADAAVKRRAKAKEMRKMLARVNGDTLSESSPSDSNQKPLPPAFAVPADRVSLHPPAFLKALIPAPQPPEVIGLFELGCENEDEILDCIAEHVKATLAEIAANASDGGDEYEGEPSHSHDAPQAAPKASTKRPRSDSSDHTASSSASGSDVGDQFVLPLAGPSHADKSPRTPRREQPGTPKTPGSSRLSKSLRSPNLSRCKPKRKRFRLEELAQRGCFSPDPIDAFASGKGKGKAA